MTDAGAVLTRRQLEMVRFGFVLFLLSEATIFATLFATRFLFAGTSQPAGLDEGLASVLTAVVVVSAAPAIAAQRAAARGDDRGTVRWLLATLALGLLLLAGIGLEWSQLAIGAGDRFGGVFRTTLGVHAVHLAAAVLVLAGLARSARRGRFTAGSHFAVEAGVLFWLFLVLVWIAFYAIFYLV